MLIDYIIIFEKAFNSVINNSFKNFADVRKEGNRSVVGTLCSVIFLNIGHTLAILRREGKHPSVRDLLTIILSGVQK